MKHKNIKGKRILITGITGFIGKHLATRLENLGAQVTGISHSRETKQIIKANIQNIDILNEIIKQKKIQICIHLAGESLVETGHSSPLQTFKTNMLGTLNILEIARQNKLEKVVIASTAHVYGKNKLPYYEGYTPKPSRPYETSKACTDLVAQSYADTYSLPVLIPRFVNIYGPGDLNFNRLIPKVMKAMFYDKKLKMWGGEIKRDYLYIDDAVSAYEYLIKAEVSSIVKNRIFNFGSGNVLSVRELVQKMLLSAELSMKIERIQSERELEIRSQYVSYKKAERLLGWKPKIDIDSGLISTSNWYKNYFK